MTLSYKDMHEQFVSNLNGTTSTETYLLMTPTVLSVFLTRLLSARRALPLVGIMTLQEFVLEFVVFVIPAVLSLTVFVDYILLLVSALSVLILAVVYYPTTISTPTQQVNSCLKSIFTIPLHQRYKSYVTNFRACTNVLTAICILAVDFPIFPRCLAKTETFGYSLMDVGVGVFCIANSIVSPEVLSHRSTEKRKNTVKVLKSCLPLLVLGVLRFFTTKQIDYQMHVSEYGVHWNFFITLAVSKLLCSFLLHFYDLKLSFLVSVVLIAIHEIILKSGVEQWVLSDMERTDFLSANREGIVSCLGYVAIFVAGEGIGHYIFRTREFFKEHVHLNYRLALLSSFLWFIMLVTEGMFPASRRLANFGYYLWILAVSVTNLTLFLFCDLLYLLYRFYIQNCGGLRHVEKEEIHIPIILDAVSFNGLPFFLIANLLTGLVNICVQTLHVNAPNSLLIIILYMFIVLLITFSLYCKRIKLKVW